jgi:hypothetical protein
LGLSVVASACVAGSVLNPFDQDRGSREEALVAVRVENRNFGDATVHALRGTERIRLGEVTGKTEKDFTVRWGYSLQMQIDIDLVGGGSCGIDPMYVDPGDRIVVTIPIELSATPCHAGKL